MMQKKSNIKRTGIILFTLILLLGCKAYQESGQLKLLQGAWFQVKGENAAFLIENKSLIYFEDTTLYNIVLKKKSLEIYEGKNLFTTYQIVRLDDHTLWLKPIEGNVMKLINEE
jgi:hypothetical protein